MMDKMTVLFPQSEKREFEYGKPIVLLGANGSGKTRFGVKIEELNDLSFNNINQLEESHIHRLSAQKSLIISTSISIFDHESSEKNLFLGTSDYHGTKNIYRFQANPATSLLNDYQQALSLLFSNAQIELQREHDEAKKCSKEGKMIPAPIETVVDKAQRIWNTLLPHRALDLSGNGVHVNYNDQKYHGKEMSDGERVILYMICQALVVKPKTLFIIDEPELHINKSIVNELWTLLESERNDCIFMYLTHDIDFAVSRSNAQYMWIKSFDGTSWGYEFLDTESLPDLPNELLFEILGTRQKIVFVEGTKDSYDYKLYQELYREKGYHVIPCGGCQDVIRVVKAKKTYEKLQQIEAYGIVDRDFRCENEIAKLKENGVYTLGVAEVENLFLVPELLEIMERVLGCDPGTAKEAEGFIIKMYNDCKNMQILEALSKEITFQLSLFELGRNQYTDEEIWKKIQSRFTIENIEAWHSEKEDIYNSANTLPEILAIFNFKELSKKISSKFGLSNKDFPKRVITVLSKDNTVKKEILTALSSYIPELP